MFAFHVENASLWKSIPAVIQADQLTRVVTYACQRRQPDTYPLSYTGHKKKSYLLHFPERLEVPFLWINMGRLEKSTIVDQRIISKLPIRIPAMEVGWILNWSFKTLHSWTSEWEADGWNQGRRQSVLFLSRKISTWSTARFHRDNTAISHWL